MTLINHVLITGLDALKPMPSDQTPVSDFIPPDCAQQKSHFSITFAGQVRTYESISRCRCIERGSIRFWHIQVESGPGGYLSVAICGESGRFSLSRYPDNPSRIAVLTYACGSTIHTSYGWHLDQSSTPLVTQGEVILEQLDHGKRVSGSFRANLLTLLALEVDPTTISPILLLLTNTSPCAYQHS